MAGAVSHCEKQKLYKKCPYEGVRKYLVQTSDKIFGQDRVSELHCSSSGLWLSAGACNFLLHSQSPGKAPNDFVSWRA